MLRYTNWGAKLIAFFSLALVAMSIFLPYLEVVAYTPLYAFIHRFSITLEIGGFSKTLQPIFFVIPALFIKSLLEFHKRHHIKELLKTPLVKVIGALLLLDVFSVVTSTSLSTSLTALVSHGMNYALFATISIWLYLANDMLSKQQLKAIGIRLFTILSVTLVIFTSINAFVSITQFFDCSTTSTGCHVWKTIDEAFPNKLLAVGHQKFSYKPVVIRAPGFFGDVNFNGMFGLFIALISAVIYATFELMKKEKGYEPIKEQKLALIGIISGLLSFLFNLSRSAILATGVMGIILLVIYVFPLIRKIGVPITLKRKFTLFVTITGASLVVLFAIGFLVPLSHNNQKTSLSQVITSYISEMFDPEEDSAQGHASLFSSAVTIGLKYPITGTGIGTFSQKYAEIIDPRFTTVSPHSTYGLIFAEQGIVGTIGFLAILIYLWKLALTTIIKTRNEVITSIQSAKRTTRDYFVLNGILLLLAFFALAIPFYSIATITYYGFFLPMVWWWGNKSLLEK